ncbi:MAG: hypothetical protein LLG04_17665 [Parachlamydia sp.]|nr:hypothetical protein [Parachlamydia sp.]
MAISQFDGIVILDAIPNGELNTARRLKEDLEDISCYYLSNKLQVRYFRIDTLSELKSGIGEVLYEISNTGLMPWLHLEGHGLSNQDGFKLGGGLEDCTWTQFKEIITPINIKMGLNLILILATCYGGSFARAIRLMDRAPVLGLIGPTRKVIVKAVEKDFPAFYKTFFETLSLKKALNALIANAPNDFYYRTTAERFFYEVWASYKEVQCTDQEICNRARKMYKELKMEGLERTPSVGQLKRLICSGEPAEFDKNRDTFFMFDIYESNRARFPVTYKEAERKVRR